MRASRPECIEKPKVDGCQAWVFRFVKLVYRLGGVYFILTRTQTAQNFMRWLVKLCTGSGIYIIFLKPRTSAIGFSKYNIYPLAFVQNLRSCARLPCARGAVIRVDSNRMTEGM